MRLRFRRLSVGPWRRSPIEAKPLRFALTRIIGNDLPPRHAPGQTLTNLRFILANEPELSGCSKRWILNRIVDPDVEAAMTATLDAYQQAHSRIDFRLDVFGRIEREKRLPESRTSTPEDGASTTEEVCKRALLRAERPRITYAIPVNAARNLALREAQEDADWILPFDGNCFLSQGAWARIREFVERQPEVRYVAVPMARASTYETAFSKIEPINAEEEPQIMFHRDAALAFDESYPYGRRDKVQLLWRLGVKGSWDRWHDDPWDLPRPKAIVSGQQVGAAGWVTRLPSGHAKFEHGRAAGRERTNAREEAILRFLGLLDERLRREALHSR